MRCRRIDAKDYSSISLSMICFRVSITSCPYICDHELTHKLNHGAAVLACLAFGVEFAEDCLFAIELAPSSDSNADDAILPAKRGDVGAGE